MAGYRPESDVKDIHDESGHQSDSESAQDLSRFAWDEMMPRKVQDTTPKPVISRDGEGNISQVDNPDGVTYKYSYDKSGQLTQMVIFDHKDGDWGQWKREEEGLWRAYDKNKPSMEVIRGEWSVDEKGIAHHTGQQDMIPVPARKAAEKAPTTKEAEAEKKPEEAQKDGKQAQEKKDGTTETDKQEPVADGRPLIEQMNDPSVSAETKLGLALEFELLGTRNFVGADGRTYHISVTPGSRRSMISIHTVDEHGHSHPVLRGSIWNDGVIRKQHDDSGNEVPFEGTWASRHMKDSPLLGGKK